LLVGRDGDGLALPVVVRVPGAVYVPTRDRATPAPDFSGARRGERGMILVDGLTQDKKSLKDE